MAVGGRLVKIRTSGRPRGGYEQGIPMSQLPIGQPGVPRGPGEDTWEPIDGKMKYDEIFEDAGTIYDAIEITPNVHGRGRGEGDGPVKVALVGYTDYEEILSL